jgi:hypothetical protein
MPEIRFSRPEAGGSPQENIAQSLGLTDPNATAVEVPQPEQGPGAVQSHFSPGDPHATASLFDPQAIEQNILGFMERKFPSLLGVMRTMFSVIGLQERTLGDGWVRYPLTQYDIRRAIKHLEAQLAEARQQRIVQDMRIQFLDASGPSGMPVVNYDYIEARLNSEIARLTAALTAGQEVAGSLVDIEVGNREVYFFGDIHENIEGLERFLNTPDASGRTLMQKMSANEAVLILGGDIIHTPSGAPSNMAAAKVLLDRILNLHNEFPNNFFVTDGNHHLVLGRYEDLLAKGGDNGIMLFQGGGFRDELIGERGVAYARTLQRYFDGLPQVIRIKSGEKVLAILGHSPVLFGYRDLSPAQIVASQFDPHMSKQLTWNRPIVPGQMDGSYTAADVVRTQRTIGSGPETAVIGGHTFNPDGISSDYRPFPEVPNHILFQASEDFQEIRCAVIKPDGSIEVRGLADVKGPVPRWVDSYGVQSPHIQAPAARIPAAPPVRRSAPPAAPAQPAAGYGVQVAGPQQAQAEVEAGVVLIPKSDGSISIRTVMPGQATVFTVPEGEEVTFGADSTNRILKGADGKTYVQFNAGSAIINQEVTGRGVQVGEFMVSMQGSDVMIMRLRNPGSGAGAAANYAGLPDAATIARAWDDFLMGEESSTAAPAEEYRAARESNVHPSETVGNAGFMVSVAGASVIIENFMRERGMELGETGRFALDNSLFGLAVYAAERTAGAMPTMESFLIGYGSFLPAAVAAGAPISYGINYVINDLGLDPNSFGSQFVSAAGTGLGIALTLSATLPTETLLLTGGATTISEMIAGGAILKAGAAGGAVGLLVAGSFLAGYGLGRALDHELNISQKGADWLIEHDYEPCNPLTSLSCAGGTAAAPFTMAADAVSDLWNWITD